MLYNSTLPRLQLLGRFFLVRGGIAVPRETAQWWTSRKQGKNGVKVASRGESKIHVEPYNRWPSFAPKARGGWGRNRFVWKWSSIPFVYFDFALNILHQWSQRNALFEPISEATPTVLPTTVQRSAAEPSSARVTLCLRSVPKSEI